jgi:phosphohistidine swiveling domain-containing protein
MIREFIDSVDVLSSKVQIYVKNKTGDLEIEGWNKDKIYVEHNIEIIGDDKKITKDLFDAMEIKIVSNPKGIYVNSYIPNIEKANHQIISSKMLVRVPNDNAIICENSFGVTTVSDLDNGISLFADNSDVIIDNVNGEIKTVNNMGSTVISDSKGHINSNSSLGPLHITDCEAEFNLTNSYDEIVIGDCVGKGFIKNSGQILITEHSGNLEIENENGRIDVTSFRGNLEILNAYQSVFLNRIKGSVEIKNDYADINAFGVSGDFTATNNFGTITANDIEGSFDLTSNSGVIKLSLDHPYLKGSRILSDFGRVSLLVDSSNDYLINALTEGGIIKTDFDIEIKRNPEQSSTSFALGDGSIPIEVKGTNTTIIITED